MEWHGKRYRQDVTKVEAKRLYPLKEAIEKIKGFAPTKFDQTVDICLHLGIDTKQAEQTIRSSISLPHGTGKSKRVIAFCSSSMAQEARKAGAVEVGAEDLIAKVAAGWLDFDVAVASPDQMRAVSKLGKLLGPKGLMPSPKTGTVTADVAKAVQEYSAGKIEFRNDVGGNVHAPIGKMSFSPAQLEENARHMIDAILKMKPASAKGVYIKKISLSGTMTPSVLVET